MNIFRNFSHLSTTTLFLASGGSKNMYLNDRVVCHADSFSFVHRSSLVTDNMFSCLSCTSLFLTTDNSVVPATTDYLYTRLENSTDYSRNQAFRDCVDSQKKDSARDMKTNDCNVSRTSDDLRTSFSSLPAFFVDSQKKDSARDMKTNDSSVSKINDDLNTSFSFAISSVNSGT